MKNVRFTGFTLFALFVLAISIAAKQAPSGKIVEVKIPAPSLKGNPLGDPAEQGAIIYLPPSYDASPSKRYPVVYLLHGANATYKAWITDNRFNSPIQPGLDAAMNSGKSREMIVVAPNGWNAYTASMYANSPSTGNWEDFIYKDVVAYMDRNYRTLARKSSRGIAGHSMGGYGATTLAMNHPDVFSVLYALSPCCLGFEGEYNDLTLLGPVLKRIGNLTSRDQLPVGSRSFNDFILNVLVAQSASFSPNAKRAPFYADFPFRERDGKFERDEAVLARWKLKMPLYMVEDRKKQLRSLRGIFIEYGEKEESTGIGRASKMFSKALSERNIPHVFEVVEGGDHTNTLNKRLETHVYPFFSDRLEFSNR